MRQQAINRLYDVIKEKDEHIETLEMQIECLQKALLKEQTQRESIDTKYMNLLARQN